MQRRYKPVLLSDPYGTSYPAPTLKVMDASTLNGGLNLWELEYKLSKNQSPDCVNVYWKDGSLSSRQGQSYVFNQAPTDQYGSPITTTAYGDFHSCYSREWLSGYVIAHKGTKLYKIAVANGTHTELFTGLGTSAGKFFVFGSSLYYMNSTDYISIDTSGTATRVTPYIPITIMNRKPDGSGGDQYQPENRLSAGLKVWFTADGTSTDYYLPYTGLDDTAVSATVNGTDYVELQEVSVLPATGVTGIVYKVGSDYYTWNGTEFVAATAPANYFTVNRTTGVVAFPTAPSQTSPVVANNVKILCYKTDEDAVQSIMSCGCITTFGSDSTIVVVCGGPSAQPNAYFWSGNHDYLDPTYFPYDNYNLAGTADEYITGFGKQQNFLVIFKERSIGKAVLSTTTIDSRDYINLSYKPVNDSIGCDRAGSIQLVQNNLVFANTYGGVYVLLDTTAAGENTVTRISRNINGDGEYNAGSAVVKSYDHLSEFPTTGERGVYYKDNETNLYYRWAPDDAEYVETKLVTPSSGLLYDMRQVGSAAVTSYDDSQRYWIIANGKAYLWDYTISSYKTAEGKLSWFYFDNINALGWFKTIDNQYYFTSNGSLVKFVDTFGDFEKCIVRRYAFAVQDFGTYEVLKDVMKVIFAVRSDTDSAMRITYRTDYETREDLTPIRAYSWRLTPRNLSHRSLSVVPFAGTAVRVPRCFHVRHFSMTLVNDVIYTDMSVISAQIVYRYSREDR